MKSWVILMMITFFMSTSTNSTVPSKSIHWYHGETETVYIDAPLASLCQEMECVNCAGLRPKQEEIYQIAKEKARIQLTDQLIDMCHYKRESGRKALTTLDEELHYLTPQSKIKLTYFQPLDTSIQQGSFTFSVSSLLQSQPTQTKIKQVLSSYCGRGWFSLYITKDNGKVSCNISVSKRRDL